MSWDTLLAQRCKDPQAQERISNPNRLGKMAPNTNTVRGHDALVALAVRLSENVKVEDRTYFLRKYERCFVGTDAVEWMLKTQVVESVQEAVAVGNQMLRSGLVHHVLNEHPFENRKLFYRCGASCPIKNNSPVRL
eukprot:494775-Prorocentrum_minimum.AAC.3